MTSWKEISKNDLDEKLGKEKPTNGNGAEKGSGNGNSKERKQIKLKRVLEFYGWSSSGEVDYSKELKRTWIFCGRTDDTSHYHGRSRDHYNQFAIVELDSNEYMVRWHKQFANTKQELDNSVEYVDNIENNEEGKSIQDFISQSGSFYSLVGKSFWIEDELLINGIKKAKPNVNDKDQKWLLNNVVGVPDSFSTTEYQHRIAEGKRCLLTEFDLGGPQISSSSSSGNSENNETKPKKDENSTTSTEIPTNTENNLSEEIKNDDPKPKPGKNPSKTLLINYKVVNIYKLSSMKKLGKQLFRTKTSTGATIGGGLGAAALGLFALLGAPLSGGASLLLVGGAVGAGAAGGWLGGEVTGEHENLSQRGGIACGIESGKGLTDKAYQAEYTIIEGEGGAKELCGNSIVPYIAKGAKEWEDSETKKYGISAEEEFILNPHPKSASVAIPKHYREKHCYFNFKVHGDEHTQYWGITPIGNDPNKYGIKWKVDLTHYVGWKMMVTIGGGSESDLLTYDGLIKEDYDNSGGLARWVAQSMIMLGTAYIGGKLLSQAAVSAATTTGDAGIRKAEATNAEILAKGKYKDGNSFKFGRFEQARLDAAEASKEDRISFAQTMTGARAGSQMTRAAGRSFAGATRLFSGGKGSYQSGINEFIHNKAHFSPLRVEARTSKIYLERWTREMNKRIADWYFPFGDDSELAEKKDFGKCQGTGRQIFANAHGEYQLSANTIFPQASPNPLIDYMTGHSVFIYTKCCGKQPHEPTCKRPRLTKDDFFSGFKAELTETISREGRKEVVEWTTTEENSITNTQFVQPTFGFVFAWCGSISDPTNKIPLGSGIGTAGAYVNTVFNGDSDAEKGKGKIGETGCYVDTEHSDKADISPFRGRQYHQIFWGYTSPSACGELEFGKGDESCNYLVTRYALNNKKAETIQTKNTEESWVLWYDSAAYNAAGGLVFGKRSTTTETKTHRIERNFNPLNISNTISLTGFSGMEGWGDNPPDAFGGGGGTNIGIPHTSASLKEELGGMSISLPHVLGQQVVMPEDIQSSLNTEDIHVGIKMPEMPQREIISQAQQQQEQIFQHLNIGTSEQNLNTERGETPGEKTGRKEKVSEK